MLIDSWKTHFRALKKASLSSAEAFNCLTAADKKRENASAE